ncbi:MAG: MFS transporter [Thermosphaera sp.]
MLRKLLKQRGLPRAGRIYIVFSGLISLVYEIPGAYFILMLYKFGVSPERIGFILLVYHITILLFDYPTGAIADRFGRKRTYCLGLVLEGSAFVTFSLAKDYSVMLLAAVISGLGVANMSGSFVAWVVDEIREEVREEARYKDLMISIFSLAGGLSRAISIVSSFVASALASFAIHIAVLVPGILLIVTGLVLMVVGRENYGSLRKSPITIAVDGLKYAFKEKRFLLCTASYCLIFGAFWAFAITWQIFLSDVFRLSRESYGLLYSMMLLSASLGSFLAPLISKRISEKGVLTLVLAGLAVSFVILGITREFITSIATILLIEFWSGAMLPPLRTVLNLLIPSEYRTSLLSLISSVGSLTRALVSPLAGVMLVSLGYSLLYPVVAFVWIVALLTLRSALAS